MFPQRFLILSVYLALLGLRVQSLPLSKVTDVDITNNVAVSDTFPGDLITGDNFGNSDVDGVDFDGIGFEDEDEDDSEEFTLGRRAGVKTKAKPAVKKTKAKPAVKKAPVVKPAKKVPSKAPAVKPPKKAPAVKPPKKAPAVKPPKKAPAKTTTTSCASAGTKSGAKGKGKRADNGAAACEVVKKLPKVGDTITVAGTSFKLEKQFNNVPVFQSGKFIVKAPRTTEKGGIENLEEEIANTEKASSVLGSGLFHSKDVVNGVPIMVLNIVEGKPLSAITLGADCEAKFDRAVALIKAQQTKLKDIAGFIQSDSNVDNFLFDDDVTTLNMIDFGDVKRGASDTDIDKVTSRNLKKNKFCGATSGGFPPLPPPPTGGTGIPPPPPLP